MKIIGIIVTVIFATTILISCDDENDAQNSADSKIDQMELDKMYEAIVAISESKPCDDVAGWKFIAIGDKACGGPAGFIAYPPDIDTDDFEDKVQAYTTAQKKYNEENGIVSDCSLEQEPVGIACGTDKAVLIYDRCELLPDSGPCEAAIPKYYFNQETQECEEFLWGGCEGVVPFETAEDCRACVSNP